MRPWCYDGLMTYDVHFSAFNGTNYCALTVSSTIDSDARRFNWRREEGREPLNLSQDDLLVFSMPVYGGFIPSLCVPLVSSLLTGHDTPAVVIATYGNRAYDNALAQMQELLEARGFHVVAAGAFVCRHSIFSTVASKRPDEADRAALLAFGEHVRSMEKHSGGHLSLPRKDASGPESFKGVSFHPDGRGNLCTGCGSCAAFCTTLAIDPSHPWDTDADKCIACGACIRICPAKARDYHCQGFVEARRAFEAKNAERKADETWFLD